MARPLRHRRDGRRACAARRSCRLAQGGRREGCGPGARRRSALVAGALLVSRPALAEENLRIVVPFGAGSGTDNTMRVFAEAYRTANGRTVIVDDKPGGGTTIGSLEVSRAKPDGNTLLYTTGGHTTNA